MKASLMQTDHVHIAFHNHRLFTFADLSASHIQTIEQAALIKKIRAGRVNVFSCGLILTEKDPAAKPRHLPISIPDREHQPLAEAVVTGAIFPQGYQPSGF